MTTTELRKLADRAQRMGVAAHARGDFLASARLLATASRYRALAAPVVRDPEAWAAVAKAGR